MLPISEADPEIKAKVEEITGPCCCSQEWRDENNWLLKKLRTRYDPHCPFHRYGEHFADFMREVRRLKQALARVSHYNQLRKS